MMKLSVIVSVSIIALTLLPQAFSASHRSDDVGEFNLTTVEFNFTKIDDQNDEYDFEYETENGDKFCGTAIKLTETKFHYIYILIADNDHWYWVYINSFEFLNQKHFTKAVHSIERDEDMLDFKEDFEDQEWLNSLLPPNVLKSLVG